MEPRCRSRSRRPALAAGLAVALGLAPAAFADATGAGVRRGLTPERPLRDFAVTHWTADDGLPTPAVTNVLQTADGYLWLTTFDGLARFDGLEFEVFDKRNVPLFETNGFHELVEDGEGTLWIGTQSAGVVLYRDRRFQPVPGDGELRLTVRAVLVDEAGTVWIGTGDSGAYRLEAGAWVAVDHPALHDVTVRDIVEDAAGVVWLATEGNGLVGLAGAAATVLTRESGLASDAVNALCVSASGMLWAGTEEGLNLIEGGVVTAVGELAGVEVYRLSEDDYGNLWVAAEQALFRINALSGEVERLDRHAGQPVRAISAVVFDREGAAWVGSYVGGLYRLKEGRLTSWSVADGLATQRVNSVHETPGGDVLVGGDGGRIQVIRRGEVSDLPLSRPLPDVRVRGMLHDRRGRLWIASYAGLLEIEDGVERWHTTETGLPTNQVRLLHEDRSGTLRVATRYAGLLERKEDGTFEVLDQSSGLNSSFILSIEEGPRGEMVLGAHEGLDVVRPDGSIEAYGPEDGIPGGIVFATATDADGTVWMATSGGIGRLRDGEIRQVTSEQGLPAEAVFDLVPDDAGHLWLSSNVGVIRLARAQLAAVMDGEAERLDAVVFDDSDGMTNRSCTGAAKILRSRDGRLWFPTLGGVSVLDPSAIKSNPVPPPVVIERFTVDGEALDPAAAGLEIAPGKREFGFGFAALSFLAPSRVDALYRLVGFDDDWTRAGSKRAVRYTNLPHGDYAFRVIAANNDGVWNREGATLSFTVRPFYYQTPWFLALAAVLGAAIVAGVVRWRSRAVRARNARLESLVAEQRRTAEANRLLIEELEDKNAELERFNYTVSHDLKSPLVTIRGFAGMLERDLERGDRERVRGDLERIDSAARRMARLLEELLELSRIGRIVHEPRDVAMGELAGRAVEQVAGEIGGVEVRVEGDLPVVSVDETRLLEVYQNLIQNAVRFMGDQPEPRVDVGVRRGRESVFFVRDNGVGIEARFHHKIFGLFERLDPATEGTGVGLTLVKRIVEVHGGRVWVESEGQGRGSTFCFTLPARPAS